MTDDDRTSAHIAFVPDFRDAEDSEALEKAIALCLEKHAENPRDAYVLHALKALLPNLRAFTKRTDTLPKEDLLAIIPSIVAALFIDSIWQVTCCNEHYPHHMHRATQQLGHILSAITQEVFEHEGQAPEPDLPFNKKGPGPNDTRH